MSTYSKFYFRPGKGEQMNTTLTPLHDERGAICGRVLDVRGRPVEGALVLLFTSPDEGPELLSRFYTDDDGHFLFGPLEGERLYLIKVFKNDVTLRELEIIAT